MTPRIEALKQYFVLDKAHHAVRVPAPGAEGAPYRDAALPAHRRSALRLKAALEAETPVIFPEERIVATRTRPALPGIFTEEEWRGIESRHFIHERGYVSNLSPDYGRILQEGLIDEFSLVIAPVADGGSAASSFERAPFLPLHGPVAFRLKDVKMMDSEVLWLRYKTMR